MALIAVVAVVAAGAGAAITFVAKGSGHRSHQVAAIVRTPTPPNATATPEPTATPSATAAPETTATPKGAIDASAEELARTAEVTAETLAADNGGSYASITPEKLKALESTIVVCAASAETACLSAAKGTENSYTVTALAAPSGGEFTIERNARGEIARNCVARSSEDTFCHNGTW